MESIIRDFTCIMEHFFNNEYFCDSQYGFIKGRSTVLQLLKMLDDWTNNLRFFGMYPAMGVALYRR